MNMTKGIRLGLLVLFVFAGGVEIASAQQSGKPNVVYFLVDNLGIGELSSYSGGPLRGTSAPRIDAVMDHPANLCFLKWRRELCATLS